MAANIEQIFQDFILNKIREIEDQNEDSAVADGVAACGEAARAETSPSVQEKKDDSKRSSSQKKHKKHKKHKSKKKKKNREKENKDSSSESGPELDRRTKHQARKGTSMVTDKKEGEENSKSRSHKHSTGKKKKKKKKKKRKVDGKGSSSDSDSEVPSRQREGQRRREELPDIIPKQDSSIKGKGDDKGRSPSPSYSSCPPHSCAGPCLPPVNQDHGTGPSSSEKPDTLVLPPQAPQSPPMGPKLPPPAPSPAEQPDKAEEVEERTNPPTETRGVDAAQLLGGCNASVSISATPDQTGTGQPCPQPRTMVAASGGKPPPPAGEEEEDRRWKKKRKSSKSPLPKSKEAKSSKRQKRSRSRTPRKSRRRGSKSRSPSRRKRSRSRSGGRRSRRSRSRSRSPSRSRRRAIYSQRDRWKREPSHSPVLILRKKRSPVRKHGSPASSPHRISDFDKEQLLEIAKANAAAMCAKAGMPIPASLRSSVLPLALPSMAMNAAMASMTAATVTAALSNMGTLSSLLPLPSITNRPPTAAPSSIAALEEVKRKVTKQANSISIKEFTDKCKMIVDSKGELPVALPHVSDEEDDGKPFGVSGLREQKAISFNINNASVRPGVRSDAGMAKEFPVSSGSQHRKKEGEALGAYGEWVPVDKAADDAAFRKAPVATSAVSSGELAVTAVAATGGVEVSAFTADNDSVFPEPPPQPVDISQAVSERIKAQRRLAENPYDVSAMCMLSRAQEQVDAWAQSNTVPGLFTGSTGAQVLSSEELSSSGPQAWLKKDQFLRAAPVSGGVGEFLMRKMGWRTGEGLGRNREGTVEPIIIDFKVDRKGLVAEGEKAQKQTGCLVVTKDLTGKHPVSALIELCNKRRIMQPDFVMVHHSGPDHRKNFLFKVTVNGIDYQPQTPSPNKKHAKAMAATVALQALGEVPADGPGLYTGPLFTAASTGPLFST